MNQKPVLHLLATPLCNRNCQDCCNKQYDMSKIPVVTEEELSSVETVCLTGGEPFIYSNPGNIARYLKEHYSNIKNVYVYTNAYELVEYFLENDTYDDFCVIDGLSVSIKNQRDQRYFDIIHNSTEINLLSSNILYVFDGLYPNYTNGFKVIDREWQKEFKLAKDSIFRRL